MENEKTWNKNVRAFFDTAYLRHRIYVLKENGAPKPWTSNKVFQTYYFCNVFRDIDKTSKWMIDNIIKPNEDNPQLWWYLMLARYMSRYDLFNTMKKEIGYPNVSRNKLYDYLIKRHAEGKPIVTNAFIVNSKVVGGYSDKINYMFNLVNNVENQMKNADEYLKNCDSLEDVYNILMLIPGVGPFMAYQYTQDFSYSERYLKNAKDKNTWTSLGLGAKRGLSRINYENVNKVVKDPIDQARKILDLWRKDVEKNIEREQYLISTKLEEEHRSNVRRMYERFKDLKLCDVQHWLCEYDKYCRGGSKKRKYPGVKNEDKS